MTKQTRKIGLGVMGWADLLFLLRIRYDSDEAMALAARVTSSSGSAPTARPATLADGADLPGVGRLDLGGDQRTTRPTTLRNSTRTTIAPTGTISIIADCSGGIEPVFALAFIRSHHLDRKDPEEGTADGGQPDVPAVASARLLRGELIASLAQGGALAGVTTSRTWARKSSGPRTTSTLSGTSGCRRPSSGTPTPPSARPSTSGTTRRSRTSSGRTCSRTRGCKGITVYRDGSRELQVLSHATARGAGTGGGRRGRSGDGDHGRVGGRLGAHPAPVASLGPRQAGAPYRRHLPDERMSVTHKFRVGEQEGYVTVGLYDDGSPGEIS